jgi:hypothetical protein
MIPVAVCFIQPLGFELSTWIVAVLVYGAIALRSRSLRWTMFAGVTAQIGLWATLSRAGIFLGDHPQAWVAPTCVALLIACYYLRDRLLPAVRDSVSWLACAGIMISSVLEVAAWGHGPSAAAALVFAGCSAAGVAAGQRLRNRPCLVTGGVSAVLIAVSAIAYIGVYQQQTWLLWGCGAGAGMGLMFLSRRGERSYLASASTRGVWKQSA